MSNTDFLSRFLLTFVALLDFNLIFFLAITILKGIQKSSAFSYNCKVEDEVPYSQYLLVVIMYSRKKDGKNLRNLGIRRTFFEHPLQILHPAHLFKM